MLDVGSSGYEAITSFNKEYSLLISLHIGAVEPINPKPFSLWIKRIASRCILMVRNLSNTTWIRVGVDSNLFLKCNDQFLVDFNQIFDDRSIPLKKLFIYRPLFNTIPQNFYIYKPFRAFYVLAKHPTTNELIWEDRQIAVLHGYPVLTGMGIGNSLRFMIWENKPMGSFSIGDNIHFRHNISDVNWFKIVQGKPFRRLSPMLYGWAQIMYTTENYAEFNGLSFMCWYDELTYLYHWGWINVFGWILPSLEISVIPSGGIKESSTSNRLLWPYLINLTVDKLIKVA